MYLNLSSGIFINFKQVKNYPSLQLLTDLHLNTKKLLFEVQFRIKNLMVKYIVFYVHCFQTPVSPSRGNMYKLFRD